MKFVEDWRTLKRLAREDPDQMVRLFAYDPFSAMRSMTAAGAVEYMRTGLHKKISSKDERAPLPHWRNVINYWEYSGEVEHDRRMIHDYLHKRIRHSGCRNLLHTKFYRDRYPHINTQEWDD
jgi:hypothetical protein